MFRKYRVAIVAFLLVAPLYIALQVGAKDKVTNFPPSYKDSASYIQKAYESQLYTLPNFKLGHYALRMYRQTVDAKYQTGIWVDMARVASQLNEFSGQINTKETIYLYSQHRLTEYQKSPDKRSQLRYTATKNHPEYLYLGVDLLSAMARADEYGLKHMNDQRLRQILKQYDFTPYATDPLMIKAWAAQLANQVFWLKQLGAQEMIDSFIQAFKNTYPDNKDDKLSHQQYTNKLYGMTHIIIAASQYYQIPVSEKQYQWIYDYFRQNIQTILTRAKDDVIAEVGLTFLLANLDKDPVVAKTRLAIQKAIDPEQQIIPSVTGKFDLAQGEHRNVLAVMLLNWQGVHAVPSLIQTPDLFNTLPYGLVLKESKTAPRHNR